MTEALVTHQSVLLQSPTTVQQSQRRERARCIVPVAFLAVVLVLSVKCPEYQGIRWGV